MAELTLDLRFIGLPVPDVRAALPLEGVTAIAGPSGAGKSTLIRAIAGLSRSARGVVRVGAEDWSGMPAWRRRVGLVFQEARLFRHLTVAENLSYGARRRGVPEEDVRRIAKMLGLAALLDRRPNTLSGGETRRVALARALASGPRLLLLDEPLTGLDGPSKEEVLGLLTGVLAEDAVPTLLVSHDAREIATLADRIVRLDRSGLRSDGAPDSVDAVVENGALRIPGQEPVGWFGRRSEGPVRLWFDRSVAPVVGAIEGRGDGIALIPCDQQGRPKYQGRFNRLILPDAELPAPR